TISISLYLEIGLPEGSEKTMFLSLYIGVTSVSLVRMGAAALIMKKLCFGVIVGAETSNSR
ncbi:MAG: hypothetical protein EBX03_05280, partial [Rhodobacteraceae bacterium]|nr:hypothetical protein [Paracoccaceae bacterium]